MTKDYFSCSKINNKIPLFNEEIKKSQKLKDCQILNVIKVMGFSKMNVY